MQPTRGTNEEPDEIRRAEIVSKLDLLEAPWTTDQAAAFLQIHPRTLTRMAQLGQIPAFRIGKHWRFLPNDMDSWMRSKVSSIQLNPVRDN